MRCGMRKQIKFQIKTIMIYLLLNVFPWVNFWPLTLASPSLVYLPKSLIHFMLILLATCNCANKFTWHWTERCLLPLFSPKERKNRKKTSRHYWKIDESFAAEEFLASLTIKWAAASSQPNGKIPVKINDLSFFFIFTKYTICMYVCISLKLNYCGGWMLIMNNERFSALFSGVLLWPKQ